MVIVILLDGLFYFNFNIVAKYVITVWWTTKARIGLYASNISSTSSIILVLLRDTTTEDDKLFKFSTYSTESEKIWALEKCEDIQKLGSFQEHYNP